MRERADICSNFRVKKAVVSSQARGSWCGGGPGGGPLASVRQTENLLLIVVFKNQKCESQPTFFCRKKLATNMPRVGRQDQHKLANAFAGQEI